MFHFKVNDIFGDICWYLCLGMLNPCLSPAEEPVLLGWGEQILFFADKSSTKHFFVIWGLILISKCYSIKLPLHCKTQILEM